MRRRPVPCDGCRDEAIPSSSAAPWWAPVAGSFCFDLARGSDGTAMTAETNFECCKTLKLEASQINPAIPSSHLRMQCYTRCEHLIAVLSDRPTPTVLLGNNWSPPEAVLTCSTAGIAV